MVVNCNLDSFEIRSMVTAESLVGIYTPRRFFVNNKKRRKQKPVSVMVVASAVESECVFTWYEKALFFFVAGGLLLISYTLVFDIDMFAHSPTVQWFEIGAAYGVTYLFVRFRHVIQEQFHRLYRAGMLWVFYARALRQVCIRGDDLIDE